MLIGVKGTVALGESNEFAQPVKHGVHVLLKLWREGCEDVVLSISTSQERAQVSRWDEKETGKG